MTEDTNRAGYVADRTATRINKAVRKEELRSRRLVCIAVVGTILIPLSFIVGGWPSIAMNVSGLVMVIYPVYTLAARAISYYRQYVTATERFASALEQVAILLSNSTDARERVQNDLMTVTDLVPPTGQGESDKPSSNASTP